MTPREQLIQEILLAPDSLVNLLLQLIPPLRSDPTHLPPQLQELLTPTNHPAPNPSPSAFDLASDLAGCLNGPPDFSTNPQYFQDFGKWPKPYAQILTLDSDFHIYRKHRNQPIPLRIPDSL